MILFMQGRQKKKKCCVFLRFAGRGWYLLLRKVIYGSFDATYLRRKLGAHTHTHHLDGDDCIQTNGKKEVLNCAVRMFPPPPEREKGVDHLLL